MENLEIRLLVSSNKLKYTNIADALGITRQHLCRLMRYPLSASNRVRILTAIERLTAERRSTTRD